MNQSRLLDLGLLWYRVSFGLGIAWHGYGKIFGGRMEGFTGGVAEMGFPVPALFAWMAALAEFGGGLLIAAGLLTRPAAIFVAVTMGVAAFIAHGADPFSKKELALAYFVGAIFLLMSGGGQFSLDHMFRRKSFKV